MPNQSAKPIPQPILVENIKNYSIVGDVELNDYVKTYRKWINSGPHNIIGLEEYSSIAFCHGTIQCFDHFYLKYSDRRFRFKKGEFMYHRTSLRYKNWEYLNDDLSQGDALIISCPFSDTGRTPEDLEYLLSQCDELNIPVLLDMAYLPLSKGTTINVRHQCIDSICTSLSKAFDGAQYLRTGIRFQRINLDDGIDIYNSVEMLPKYDMEISIYLMNKYPINYQWQRVGDKYKKLCKEFNLQETDCIIFGTTTDDKYIAFNRGNSWHRVCLSDDLGDI